MQGRKIRYPWLIYFACDLLAIVGAYYATLAIRFHSLWGERAFTLINRLLRVRDTGKLPYELQVFYETSAPRIIFQITVVLCVLYGLRDLYARRRFILRRPLAWNVLLANIMALALFYAYFYLTRNDYHPRSVFFTLIALNTLVCLGLRLLAERVMHWLAVVHGFDRCAALLVGSGEGCKVLKEYLATVRPYGIQVTRELQLDSRASFEPQIARLRTVSREMQVNMIIVSEPSLEIGQLMQLLELADELDVSMKIHSEKMGVLNRRARLAVDVIHDTPLVHFEPPSRVRAYGRFERIVSPVAGALALVVLAPLLGLIALLIKLTSRGPVLFVQERIGVNGKAFQMLKFRTMHDRAEEAQSQLEEFNESGDGLFKMKKDPRVTMVGRFLRRFSLDELPQLVNVVRGEMTLVGPRPLPQRDFENYYEEWHYSRHEGMPGLTCLWQVSGRSDLDFHNMCILDVYYLRNRSWVLDLKIILKTCWVVLFARGAY